MKSDPKLRNPVTQLEVLLRIPRAEETEDSENPEEVVTRAEARAREDQKKVLRRSAQCIGSKREYADSLHRQADILHDRGDYEAALVLYHRATTAYPRDPRHGVAVRRTSAAISSATNPSGALKKFLSGTKNAAQLAANYCPETAALKARRLLEESPDPVSAIDQILKYFDSRKDFWRDPQSAQDRRRGSLVPQSRIMLRQLRVMASGALQNLQAASACGDAGSAMRIGEELMAVSAALPDGNRYQVWARHYLSMAQISLGRHDRAVDQASVMVALARESGDAVLRSRSMATLGRVHLSFGHLDAAARAWEKLVPEVEDAVPKAWLLHEIGRCYFEMKRHGRALETARRCLEYAEEGNSRKWLLHGKLLSGQALVELGRLGEAVEVLRAAGKAAQEEDDGSTVEYVKDLIDRVTGLLRRDVCPEEDETKDEGVKREVRGWRAWSKSDDALREGRSSQWNLYGSSGGAAKSRMLPESLAGRSQPTRRGRMRNVRVRRAQRRGKDIGRIGNSTLTIRPSGSGTFDLRRREEADPSESPKRIGRSGRYRRKTEAPSRRGGDVDRGDLLTSRTRVICKAPRDKNSGRKLRDPDGEGNQVDVERGDLLTSRTRVICKSPRDKNSGRKLEDPDGEGNEIDVERGDLLTSRTRVICKAPRNKNSGWKSDDPDGQANPLDEDQLGFASEKSSNKGVNFVINELRKFSIIVDQNPATWDAGAVELFRDGVEFSGANPIVRLLDGPNTGEHFGDDRTEESEISRSRARPDEEGVDQEEGAEDVGSSLSPGSPASTGKTYLVDEGEKMSPSGPRSRSGDYQETAGNEKKYGSPFDISSEGLSWRNDSKIARNVPGTIVDATGDSIFGGKMKKTMSVKNVSVRRSIEEVREKHNCETSPTRYGLVDEHRGNETPGLRAVVEGHLAIGESISTSRSYGLAFSTGRNPPFRDSRSKSPGKGNKLPSP